MHEIEAPDAPRDDDTGPDQVDGGRDAGADAGTDAPSFDAGVDAGRPRPTFERVQRAEAEAMNPTASFASAPTPGNLLVAIAFHRFDAATAEIAGWDRRLEDHYQTGMGDRRGLAVFSRVAAPGDVASVRVTWSPTRDSRLLIQEFRAVSTAGDVTSPWSFEQAAVRNSVGSDVTTLGVTTSDTPDGALLLVAAFGSRDDPGEVSFSGLSDAITLRSGRTVASAFAGADGGEPVGSTASWPTARKATVGLLAFRYEY